MEERGFIMAEITRRSAIAGGAVALAAAAVAGAGTALAANERLDGPGFNAGWGDTELTDPTILDTPYGEVIDNWFQYGWSYGAEFAEQPERDHVCVIVSSPAVGGNGDTLAETVVDEIGDAADVEVIHLRELQISPLMTIGADTPVVQTQLMHDGMDTVIAALHRSNIVIGIAPTYYNSIDYRMMNMLTRLWNSPWKDPDYQWGPTKRTAVMLTCTGTKPDFLKTCCRGIFTMADLSIISPEYKCEVFPSCGAPTTVANNDEYLETARAMARWAIRAE